jgi:hypothetical protein
MVRDYRGFFLDYCIYWPLTGRTTNNYYTIAVSKIYSSLLHCYAPTGAAI